jgi:large subunit ribosomal protein L6
MSRVGKRPIEIPAGVKVNIVPQGLEHIGTYRSCLLEVTGPKGVLKRTFHPNISIEVSDGKILVKRKYEDKLTRSLHGLSRVLIANMIRGVTQGYEKRLTVVGVGYRIQVEAKKLTMHLGFSHPVVYDAPPGIELKLDKQNTIIVNGIDKELVGEVSAQIRRLKPPEPYKGRGIRYEDEYVRRKVGKKAI